MKWTKLIYDTEVGLNQDLSIECDATGQPRPTISWLRHPNNIIKTSLNSTCKFVLSRLLYTNLLWIVF